MSPVTTLNNTTCVVIMERGKEECVRGPQTQNSVLQCERAHIRDFDIRRNVCVYLCNTFTFTIDCAPTL